jgi:hypothetical protein
MPLFPVKNVRITRVKKIFSDQRKLGKQQTCSDKKTPAVNYEY